MRTPAASFLTLALMSSFACFAGNSIRPSGKRVTVRRDVPPFQGLRVSAGIRGEVQPGPSSVELEGDEEVIASLIVEVDQGVLEVRYPDHTGLGCLFGTCREHEVVVHVRAPLIRELGASGGSEIVAKLPARSPLSLHASGGAGIEASSVDADVVEAHASGGSRLQLEGRTGRLELHLSGGSRGRLAKLSAGDVDVHGSGGSTVEVEASGALAGSLSGGSDLHVRGKASGRVSTSGGSEVVFEDGRKGRDADPEDD